MAALEFDLDMVFSGQDFAAAIHARPAQRNRR